MSWFKRIAILLGIGAVLLVGRVLFAPRRAGVVEALEQARERLAQSSRDEREIARDLTRIVEEARSQGRGEIVAQALLTRAQVFETLGENDTARADLQTVLTEHRPGDPELALHCAALEAEDGLTAEALVNSRAVARNHPDFTPAWRQVGRLTRTLAREEVDEAVELARTELVRRDAREAQALIVRLGALDSRDQASRALGDELRALFSIEDRELLTAIFDRTEEASQLHREARAALARAFAGGADGASVSDYIELLTESGRADLGIALGEAAQLHPALDSDLEIREAMLDALVDLDDEERARILVQHSSWEDVHPGPALCEKALRVLFEADAQRAMAPVLRAIRGVRDPDIQETGLFYQAVLSTVAAQVNEQKVLWERSLQRWDTYLKDEQPREPFTGALAYAYLQRATVRGELGDVRGEYADLVHALTPDRETVPEEWLAQITPDDYLRLAIKGVQIPNAGYRLPEERWTEAMSLAPERTRELFPRWKELGELSLENDAGYTFDYVYRSSGLRGNPMPTIAVGPHTLFRVAVKHLDLGQHEAALGVGRRLLEDYPGLVPAWDVAISAQLGRGSRLQVAVDLLDRITLSGMDASARALLARLGLETLNDAQFLELMRLDPGGLGRTTMAAHLLEQGRHEAVLRCLREGTPEEAGERALLRARALLGLGRAQEALEILERLRTGEETAEEALALEVETRLEDASRDGLEAAVSHFLLLLEEEPRPRTTALELATALMREREFELAGSLYEALDAHVDTRGGDVLEGMALQRAMLGDRGGALQALERAEAFLEDGDVEFARLLLALEERDWRATPLLAEQLRLSGMRLDPWLDAVLTLLEERLEVGAEMARAGLEEDPESPQWALLHAAACLLADQTFELSRAFGRGAAEAATALMRGSADAGRDPREILGLLLTIERGSWQVRAMPRLLEITSAEAVPWPGWLRARALERGGRFAEAQEAYEYLTGIQRRFAPGWDGRRRLLRGAGFAAWDEERLALRARRAATLHRSVKSTRIDNALDRAAQHLAANEPAEAIALLEEVLGRAKSRSVEGRMILGEIYRLQGQLRQAATAFGLALPPEGQRKDDPLVRAYVEALVAAGRPGVPKDSGLEQVRVVDGLRQLCERFPRDPLPALELLRLRVERERRNPALVVELIERALETLRDETNHVPLDELRPGTATAWGRFLVTHAPAVAEEALIEDLTARPGDLDLWIILAEALAAQGRRDDATALFTAVIAMSDHPGAHLGYAWHLTENGGPLAAIVEQLAIVSDFRDLSPADRERERFVRALALLRYSDNPPLDRVLDTLERMWAERRNLLAVPVLSVGQAYVEALARSGRPEDVEVLTNLLEALARVGELDPYLADVSLAMSGLLAEL